MWGHFGKSDLVQTDGRPETKLTVGWGCLHPYYLYWPPLKHPRCLIHHQAISKRSLEYIGLTHIRHIVKMFWAMKCPELAELWWISDIMMQGFRIVRLCARNPRNVCLTFPCFLATNLSMPACPKLLTSQKTSSQRPGTRPTPPTSGALNILKTLLRNFEYCLMSYVSLVWGKFPAEFD